MDIPSSILPPTGGSEAPSPALDPTPPEAAPSAPASETTPSISDEQLIEATASALLDGRIEMSEIMARAGIEHSSSTRKVARKRGVVTGVLPSGEGDPTRPHTCRHRVCTYTRRGWSDIRSRNTHEAKQVNHPCDPPCAQCNAVKKTPSHLVGKIFCSHDGCRKTHDRRHAKAHARNRSFHEAACSTLCSECRSRGWSPVIRAGDEIMEQISTSTPRPPSI